MKTKSNKNICWTPATKHARDFIPNNGKITIDDKKGGLVIWWVHNPSTGQSMATMYFNGGCSGASITRKTSGYGYDKPSSAVAYVMWEALKREGQAWSYGNKLLDYENGVRIEHKYTLTPAVKKALEILGKNLAGVGLESLRGKKVRGVRVGGVD